MFPKKTSTTFIQLEAQRRPFHLIRILKQSDQNKQT